MIRKKRDAHRRASGPEPGLRRSRGINYEEVVSVAAALFAEKGFGKTSLEDIGEKLGIRKTSLYHYIESKEELLLEIYQRLLAMVETRLQDVAKVQGLAPDERLRRMVHAYVEVMTSNIDMAAMITNEEKELPPAKRLKILKRSRSVERMFEALIIEGQELGLIRPLTPRLTVLAMFGMCNFVTYWYRWTGFSADQIASEFCLILESGWLTDGSRVRGAWPRPTTLAEAFEAPRKDLSRLRAELDQLATDIERTSTILEHALAGTNAPKKA